MGITMIRNVVREGKWIWAAGIGGYSLGVIIYGFGSLAGPCFGIEATPIAFLIKAY
jgi:hypothetical protein